MPPLSIIIPCYNEAHTVARVVDEAVALVVGGTKAEVIVVDDGSSDGSREVLAELARNNSELKVLYHDRNQGKGAAVRTGLTYAHGEYTIVRDADLEYEWTDVIRLFDHAQANHLDVVFGSRNLDGNKPSSSLFYWGGRLVTAVANMLYSLRLTDEPTGYKLVRTNILRGLNLKCQGFEFCPEVTAKLARLGYAIPEIPITYHPRSITQGKKIRVSDGWVAVLTLLRYKTWQPTDHFNMLDRFIRWLRVREAVSGLGAGAHLLDIGCGPVVYLHRYLLRHGVSHTYVGLDRRPPAAYLGTDNFVAYDLEAGGSLPLADNSFDCIFLLAFIEHVQNPLPLLTEARRVLKSGGRLVLTTPSPQSRLVLELMAWLRLISREEIEEHKHYYSPPELYKLLTSAGFVASDIHCSRFELGLNVAARAVKS